MARSLKRIALVVTYGTLLSKVGGLVRQLVIAAAFGVGAAYDAYNYAYVLPGFLLILLGGINGPFHSAMVSVLSRRPREEGAHILATLNTMVSALLLLVTIVLVLAADPLITLVGPGLSPELHRIAVVQLQVMAPMALLAGLIGLGFGSLNAADEFWIPAISPLMSSLALIVGIGLLWWQAGSAISTPALALWGGVVLALSTLVGAFLQWLLQLPALMKQGLVQLRLAWDWRHPGVQEVWQVMGPATLSSGMLQINVFTDLFFASGLLGAAAGLGYANLLVQTPLGLISNALLVPLLPTFSRLTAAQDRPELIARIRQGLMLSTASMLPLGALFLALATPVVASGVRAGCLQSRCGGARDGLVDGLWTWHARLSRPRCVGARVLRPWRRHHTLSPFGHRHWPQCGVRLGPCRWSNALGSATSLQFRCSGFGVGHRLDQCAHLRRPVVGPAASAESVAVKTVGPDGLRLMVAAVGAGIVAWGLSEGVRWPVDLVGRLLQVGLSGSLGGLVFMALGQAFDVQEVREISQGLTRRFIRR